MECFECGAEMTVSVERVPYTAGGLPNVVLEGIEVSRCPACGTTETAIPNMAGLHRSLARTIAEKPEPLTGDEVRFLRKYRDLSGVELAHEMGVTPETVSRWEHGTLRMGPTAERLLRMMALYDATPPAYPATGEEAPEPVELTMRPSRRGWAVSARKAA